MRITTGRDGNDTIAVTKQEKNRLHDAVTVCRQFERHGTEEMKEQSTEAMSALGSLLDMIHAAEKAVA